MSDGVNEIILVGRIGTKAELRQTGAGQAVMTLRVGTTHREKTAWHSVVLWDHNARFADEYISVGDLVYVHGHMDYRPYTASDGSDRVSAEINTHRLQLLHSKNRGSTERTEPPADYPTEGNTI